MLQLSNITLSFAGQSVLDELTLSLSPGERLALIGRNGTGKSTLLKIIMGELAVDSGEVSVSKNYEIGFLRQHISFSKETVIEECTQGKYQDYQAERLLFGLGFEKEDMQRAPSEFSGGYQLRIELAKCLIQEPNLLLLDEPTNYLDLPSISWLEDFLKRYPGEMIIVSHDRYFLNKVCTHTGGIHLKTLRKVKGGTAKYYEQIDSEKEMELKTKDNIEKRKKELQGFVDRFRAKARQANQAQSKMKMIEKLDQIEFSQDEKHFDGFHFRYKPFEAKNFINAKGISFSYEGGPELFEKLDFSINSNSRLAIIGKNGKGKSTLLNILAGYLKKKSGDLYVHPKVEIGYFGQMNIDRLSDGNDILDEIYNSNTNLGTSEVHAIAGAMAFSGDLASKKIKILSGGEKARVSLGKILAKPCNLLLLDEPTHHLDVESIEILLREIKSFPGAVVVVTHDEFVLNSFAKEIVAFHHGKVEHLPYTYPEFLDKVGWEAEEKKPLTKESKLSYKEQKKRRQEIVRERSKYLKPIVKEIEKLEDVIVVNEDEMERLKGELISASEKGESEKIQACSKDLAFVEKIIEESFEQLETLSTQKDEIEKKYPL